MAASHIAYFKTRNTLSTQKLLNQVYSYHNFRYFFSIDCRQCYDLISKFHVTLESLLRQGLVNYYRDKYEP